jgi:hypothetical protein
VGPCRRQLLQNTNGLNINTFIGNADPSLVGQAYNAAIQSGALKTGLHGIDLDIFGTPSFTASRYAFHNNSFPFEYLTYQERNPSALISSRAEGLRFSKPKLWSCKRFTCRVRRTNEATVDSPQIGHPSIGHILKDKSSK